MASAITLNTRELERNLRRASDREVGRAMAIALTRTALDIREGEAEHIERTFPGASSRGGQFLSGFRAFPAKPRQLVAFVTPRGTTPFGAPSKSESILLEHRRGGFITAAGFVKRLDVGGKLAVPTRVKRGGAGRIRKSETPAVVLGPGGRGFIARRAQGGDGIFVRVGKKREPIKLAYTLVPRAQLDESVEFYRTAERIAQRQFVAKARRAFDQIRFPGAGL